jgi:uncharacterized iron-regulated membrane protein
MKLRRVFFWVHLTTGCCAGVVILLMSVTGVLLAYQRQILAAVDSEYRYSQPPAEGQQLSVETLLQRFVSAGQALPASVTLRADPAAAAEMNFGRERTVYVNGYSGTIAGEGSKRARAFFSSVMAWHRWLGMQGQTRNLGKQ